MDMVKDIKILEAAYNDAQDVTAAFNKNILNVINQYAGTDFNPDLFEHMAFYNYAENRIEMHLKARCDMIIHSPEFISRIFIRKGESIHTENSHKYTMDNISEIADYTGWITENIFTDNKEWYSLVEFRSRD
jgi:L-histidine N-alpha-methyltransferase